MHVAGGRREALGAQRGGGLYEKLSWLDGTRMSLRDPGLSAPPLRRILAERCNASRLIEERTGGLEVATRACLIGELRACFEKRRHGGREGRGS